MSKCVARECGNEGWAAEPVLGATFCFKHWDLAKSSFFKDGFRLKDTYQYGSRSVHRTKKVYFLASKRYIKIGSSMDPLARLKAFRSGIDESAKPADLDAEALDCIGWIHGTRSLEFDLHRKFARHQVVGEWFSRTPELEARINSIIEEVSA